jgi:O-antigen/teichoic acid export membrane protein
LSIRALSRDVAFYGSLDFLQRSLAIVLVPIYTRVLSQADYGNLDLILTVWSILTVLVDLQFVAGFSRLYLEKAAKGEGGRFVGTALATRVGIASAVAMAVLALGYAGFLEVRFIPSFLAHRAAWTLVILGIPVAMAYDILLAQTQMLRRKKWFFAGAFGNTLVSTLLCVLFTVVIPWGITGVALGQMVGTFIATCILFGGLRRDISFGYHMELLKEIASYSLPLVPGRWLSHFSAYIGRFFVFGGLGAAENAILAITVKLAAVVGLFCLAFRSAWQPLAMAYIGEREGEPFYVRSLRVFMAGGLFSVAALIVMSRPILAILAPGAYGVAEYYVPVFLVASIIGELDVNLQLGNQIAKKTYWISAGSAVAFAINVVFLMVFTKRFGIFAAGVGLLLAFAAKALLTYVTGQRNYKIRYDRPSLVIFLAGCMALLALTAGRAADVLNDAAFFAGVGAIGLLLPWIIVTPRERQVAREWLAARFTRLRNAHSS